VDDKDSTASEGLLFVPGRDGNSYVVAGIGNCTDRDIVIPSEYNGKPVVGIINQAFYECYDLNSVIIPNSVTKIEDSAFAYCGNLTSITFSESVTSIGQWALLGSGLEKITVAKGNPVYHSDGNCLIETKSKTLIAGCKTSVIPTDGSVTNIGTSAFADCAGLDSISIPDAVTVIGDRAFMNCHDLSIISIPDSVSAVTERMLFGCSSLKYVYLPSSITSVAWGAFDYCENLWNVYYDGTVAQCDAIDWPLGYWEFDVHCTDGDTCYK
jgi:hypothetical protein